MFKFITDFFKSTNTLKPKGDPLIASFLVQSSSGMAYVNESVDGIRSYHNRSLVFHEEMTENLLRQENSRLKVQVQEYKADLEFTEMCFLQQHKDIKSIGKKLRDLRLMNRNYSDELDRLKSKRLAALERKIPSGYRLVKE